MHLQHKLIGIQFQDLFHMPSLATFHLSLAVLVHYRSQTIFRVRAWSPYLQCQFHVSAPTLFLFIFYTQRDYHPLWFAFPCKICLHNKNTVARKLRPVTVSLATTKVIFSIFFPPVTKMIQFTGYAPVAIQHRFMWDCSHIRVSSFRYSGIKISFANSPRPYAG